METSLAEDRGHSVERVALRERVEQALSLAMAQDNIPLILAAALTRLNDLEWSATADVFTKAFLPLCRDKPRTTQSKIKTQNSRTSDRRKIALAHVASEGRITAAEYQALAGINPKQAQWDINKLIQKGLLVRVGKTCRAYYVANNEPPLTECD